MKPSHGTMLVIGGAVLALTALFVIVNYAPASIADKFTSGGK